MTVQCGYVTDFMSSPSIPSNISVEIWIQLPVVSSVNRPFKWVFVGTTRDGNYPAKTTFRMGNHHHFHLACDGSLEGFYEIRIYYSFDGMGTERFGGTYGVVGTGPAWDGTTRNHGILVLASRFPISLFYSCYNLVNLQR